MDTLESTLSQLSTGDSSPMDATGDLDTAMSEQTKESTPLKSALKSSPKKVSIFKHNRVMANEFAQEEKAEAVAPTVTPVVKDEEPSLPPKKMSKFAMQRAAANPNKSEQPQSSGSVSTKPAKGGLSDLVVERGVVPTLKQETTTIAHKAVVAETPAPAPTPVASLKDIIENTFTKKSTEVPEPAAPAARSAKSSLFRLRQQQQQKQQQRSYFEPEPAVPDSSFVDPDDDDSYVSSGLIIPAVQSHSSKGKTQASTIVERAPKEKSVTPKGPTLRAIPVVESSKLRDTSLMKGAIVEREDIDSVDEDELEDDMLMRQVVSEYQERRQAMIAKHGMFNREGIDKMWEEQVIIPPGMVIPEPQALTEGVQIIKEDEDQEMEDVDQDEEEQEEQAMEVDDRNERPKKLSLFRAARLTGSLAKQ
ncbi:hypothetical protein BGW38_002852 [Lunasporangiospora selenospora]|uniref:DUF3835 domain-containing protein n=1 Tax=Lunasporangiospora selenospora TaxID=979761 RepID=A0A9P6FTK6_9FUNG|nr:hypothetical protein BGW38_002852 [Lunasporangiospora selenospora]